MISPLANSNTNVYPIPFLTFARKYPFAKMYISRSGLFSMVRPLQIPINRTADIKHSINFRILKITGLTCPQLKQIHFYNPTPLDGLFSGISSISARHSGPSHFRWSYPLQLNISKYQLTILKYFLFSSKNSIESQRIQ